MNEGKMYDVPFFFPLQYYSTYPKCKWTVDEFQKTFKIDFSRNQRCIIVRYGCVGLVAWRAGQRDPGKYVAPDQMQGVELECYLTLAAVKEWVRCKNPKVLFIFAKRGSGKDDKPPEKLKINPHGKVNSDCILGPESGTTKAWDYATIWEVPEGKRPKEFKDMCYMLRKHEFRQSSICRIRQSHNASIGL